MSQNVSSAAVVIDALSVNAISLPICMLGNLQAFIVFKINFFVQKNLSQEHYKNTKRLRSKSETTFLTV